MQDPASMYEVESDQKLVRQPWASMYTSVLTPSHVHMHLCTQPTRMGYNRIILTLRFGGHTLTTFEGTLKTESGHLNHVGVPRGPPSPLTAPEKQSHKIVTPL